MAAFIKTNGEITNVTPKNGTDYKYEELKEFVVTNSVTKGKKKKDIDYIAIIDSYCEEEAVYVKNIFEIIKKL